MFKLADLFVQITGNSAPLTTVLSGVQGKLTGLLGMAGRVGSQMAGGILGPLLGIVGGAGTAGLAIGGALAAGAAVGLVKCATLASNLNETISKTEQVFGSATDAVTTAADEMASKFGVVKTEFLDAASMFGLIAQGAGIASGKSAEMSVSMAKLAADVSSFYNIPVDVALEKMRAGLTGESEPLKALGVLMTEDATKAKALAMGLAKPGEELTNQAKVMARYAIIQEGLSKAQGDLERTGGGFANQWRMFTGQLENMATSIGSLVLPALTGLLKVANYVLGGIVGLVDNVVGAWQGMLAWFGVGGEEAAGRTARLNEITARNDKMAADTAASQVKPEKKKEKEAKAETLSFENFAKRLQEGAFSEKDKQGKEALKIQREQLAQLKLLNEQQRQPARNQPVVAIAKK